MCGLYGVSTSGYYAWRKRLASVRSVSDAALVEQIKAIHQASDHPYGSPRVRAALQRSGRPVGRRRVERLMREHGIQGCTTRLYRRMPGMGEFFGGTHKRARSIALSAPNQVWARERSRCLVSVPLRAPASGYAKRSPHRRTALQLFVLFAPRMLSSFLPSPPRYEKVGLASLVFQREREVKCSMQRGGYLLCPCSPSL